MGNVIKKVKIKKEDGTFTDYIPIGVDAENVNVDGESIQVKLNKMPYYYNNIEDMKNDESLKNGDMAITLGYYNANDGGNGEYRIVTGNYIDDGGSYHELNNGLFAELIVTGEEINVKQFGAYGDDIHDDTDVLQKAIDWIDSHNKSGIYVPDGTFKITKPLFLYNGRAIRGNNDYSSAIHKTTTTKSNKENFNYDAIIILTTNDFNLDVMTQQHKIENIRLEGCVTSYVENKNFADRQYGIFSRNLSTPKTRISDFRIRNVDVGIYADTMYTAWIKNCSWLHAHYRAIYIQSKSHGLNIANINTGGAHEIGIELNGASYSTLSNVLVEWNYGCIAYRLSFWRGMLVNCGAEVGTGTSTGISMTHSNVTISGGFFVANPIETSNIFDLNDSILEVETTALSVPAEEDENHKKIYPPYLGTVAKIRNQSHLIWGAGNSMEHLSNRMITSSGNNNFFTTGGRTIYLDDRQIGILNRNKENVFENSFDITLNDMQYQRKNIYMDSINTPLVNSHKDMTDPNMGKAYFKGDIGFINNSTKNGKAFWICNRNNPEQTQSQGTISEIISNSKIKMTSLELENSDTTGVRLYRSPYIRGVDSEASGWINSIDYANNTITLGGRSEESLPFQIGEKIKFSGNNDPRNGDYLYVPIIAAGATQQRPSQSIEPGTMFFDSTLGKPIWYTGSNWVDSTGTQV